MNKLSRPGPLDVYASRRSVWVVVRELPAAPYQSAQGAVRVLVREVTRWGVPVRGRGRRDEKTFWPGSRRPVFTPDGELAAHVREALAMEPPHDPERRGRVAAAAAERLGRFERRHAARGRARFKVRFSPAGARPVDVPCPSLEAAKAAGDEALRERLAQVVYIVCLAEERRVLRRTRAGDWVLDRKRTEAMQ